MHQKLGGGVSPFFTTPPSEILVLLVTSYQIRTTIRRQIAQKRAAVLLIRKGKEEAGANHATGSSLVERLVFAYSQMLIMLGQWGEPWTLEPETAYIAQEIGRQ